ncbi:TPA: lipoyl(octanoyl) transferase LipB [Legionella pneumophila subsp. pneumophila]|uniref:lipoyl(octanoyl) transferase LipB n=1 Tax=Legionella pneumophila TaxID=446 RepID=UPI0001E3C5C1|nr:lipoyl(octanoyl) transferase LipB [Legionella pneumophila]MDC8030074.1 lipoyl(octanoyl) transferase LipB [Legionella pneumophila subsp. pneumophila]MDW8869968.1 lipoyl(octanoyl) transferase LipB [Legionella pneumophila]MDW8915841.1 lipoyl(octanoyl) transferase LipB [Legionella pneumophila]MDW8925507.1 lipoyl(octanoyl) transferase LipB [Legionella pneumophila]MDW8931581.1 lipoyl(octanoyl) transferase LipB [Legionella pneumophila]
MIIHNLGIKDYTEIWEQMKEFTAVRDSNSYDELWLLEHHPVYTQGQAGKPEHVLNPNSIKIVQSDRGGQVTYHGPGQLVAYVLMDIRRRNLGIRTLVAKLEEILISVLEYYRIPANIRSGAPGVYVGEKKIASIGLRVKNGCTYHGIALNVNMDLSPFLGINPCGFAKMEMTQMSHFHPNIQLEEVSQHFVQYFLTQFK